MLSLKIDGMMTYYFNRHSVVIFVPLYNYEYLYICCMLTTATSSHILEVHRFL